MVKKMISIGNSDFVDIIRNGYCYVDKTMMIKDVIDSGSEAMLFTRPRRFGKSLCLNMLKAFFEINEDNADLFQTLNIWQCGEAYQKFQGRYPVIYLSFFDFSESSWESAQEYIKKKISKEFIRHNCLGDSDVLAKEERHVFQMVKDRTAPFIDYKSSLLELTEWLYRFYGVRPFVLIDEYDKPVQKAQTAGYYDEMIDFMRGFYSGGLKDNPYLNKGILTGVMRIAKESIFSGMNNFDVYSVFSDQFSDYFGFTEAEVSGLVQSYGTAGDMMTIKDWYDGYSFGNSDIYNPWSVLQYFAKGRVAEAYWLGTSGNDIIHTMFSNVTSSLFEDLTRLVQGESVTALIPVEMAYPDIQKDHSGYGLYGALLMTGYLKKVNEKHLGGNKRTGQNLKYRCELRIPNREIMEVYQAEILDYLAWHFVGNM